jgi:hypothetical protein
VIWRSNIVLSAVVALLFATTACSGETESVSASVCASQIRWIGGDSGSPEMHPGRDCIACHAGNSGPNFAIAGTVYGADKQADNCFGVEGSQVVITGSDGQVVTLVPNAAGNFYSSTPIALPYTAKVVQNGVERVMATPQSSGACNSCHALVPQNSAPGRILIPGI